MKEKIIAIVFCLAICGISGSTLVRKLIKSRASETVQSQEQVEENSIAEIHEQEKKLMEESKAESSESDDEDSTVNDDTEENTSFLGAISKSINSFTDDLSGKEQGAEINSKVSKVTSGDSYIESNTVLLGKDNWLFYKARDDGDCIADYRGTNHYSKQKMKSIMQKLESDAEFIKEKNSELVLFMVPNKENVYAEQMPDNVKRESEKSRLDLFAEYLQKHSDLSVVYPKEELIAAKSTYQTYYKTDTHWNQIGVFIGIQTLKEQLDGNFDSLSSVKFYRKKKNYAGDLAKLCKMTDTFHDDAQYALKSKSVDKSIKSKKKLLIIGDSFSELMPTIASEYFAEVKTVGVWYYKSEDITKYKPDVVVWECAERYLDRYDWIRLKK